MASKRKLKKQIHYACGDMAAETILASHFIEGFDRKIAEGLVSQIAQLQIETLSRCSFNFDHSPRDFENRAEYNRARRAYFKAAFKQLRNDFTARAQEIVHAMNQALPQAVRDQLKNS